MPKSERGIVQRVRRTMRATAVLGLGALVWAVVAAIPGPQKAPDEAAGGWGSEVLADIHQGMAVTSPVGAANACGLGASSCFKCHNGQRAAAPRMDALSAPWHTQHKTVNNSCVGCHQGNPRLMKQEMAHAKLVANPRAAPDNACASCHAGANAVELVTPYRSINGGDKQ